MEDSDFDPEGGEAGVPGPARKRKPSSGARRRSSAKPAKRGKKPKGKKGKVTPPYYTTPLLHHYYTEHTPTALPLAASSAGRPAECAAEAHF